MQDAFLESEPVVPKESRPVQFVAGRHGPLPFRIRPQYGFSLEDGPVRHFRLEVQFLADYPEAARHYVPARFLDRFCQLGEGVCRQFVVAVEEEYVFTRCGIQGGVPGGGKAPVGLVLQDAERDVAGIGSDEFPCQVHAAVPAAVVDQQALHASCIVLGCHAGEAGIDVGFHPEDGYYDRYEGLIVHLRLV